MGKIVHIENGTKFGRLTVICEAKSDIYVKPDGYTQRVRWMKVGCICGVIIEAKLKNLRTGASQSCGCLQKELVKANRTTHGMRKHQLYQVWCNMIQRRNNPNATYYHNYGGRGITVCKEWQGSNGFSNFYTDCMSLPKDQQWQPGLDIDRRDNDRGYESCNIRFITRPDNLLNRRNNIWIPIPNELTDKEFESIKSLCRVKDRYYEMLFMDLFDLKGAVKFRTAQARYNILKWSAFKAVNTPLLINRL